MARKSITSPRKTATQARARFTVDALLEATARILVRDGFDRASTNHIAREAGVSIGSLYQYFPGKEALVAAVIQRHNQRLATIVQRALDAAASAPVEAGIHLLVAAAIEAHAVEPDLHCVLAEQTPRAGALANVALLQRSAYEPFRSYLEARRAEVSITDSDLAAFICVTTIEALTHTAVIHRPDMIEAPRRETLIREATRLIAGYLAPAPEG